MTISRWLVLLMLFVAPITSAQPFYDYTSGIQSTGLFYFPGHQFSQAKLDDGVFYIADRTLGLVILGLEDDGSFTEISSLAIQWGLYFVVTDKGILCGVDTHDGLHVIDVSDPANPVEMGSLTLPTRGEALAMKDGLVFVAAGYGGLLTVDISDPSAPSLVHTMATTRARDVYLVNDLAYLADGSGGLRVLDISDPLAPVILQTVSLPSLATSLDVNDGVLAVVEVSDNLVEGIQLFDVSQPASPESLDFLPSDFALPVNEVAIRNGWIFASTSMTLQAVQLSDPGNIVQHECSYPVYPHTSSLVVDGDRAYVLGGPQIEVFDITNPVLPPLFRIPLNSIPSRVAISGDLWCVVSDDYRLEIYRRQGEEAPSLQGSLDLSQQTRGIATSGSLVFLSIYGQGVWIVDITDPAAPVHLSTIDLVGFESDLAVWEDKLVVLTTGYGYLSVVDVSDPYDPTLLGSIQCNGWGLAVANGAAYVGGNLGGLGVFNLADPAHPVLASVTALPGLPRQVSAQGNYLVTAEYNAGISLLDLTQPLTPTLLGSVDVPQTGPYKAYLVGEYVYVDSGFCGITVVDATNPMLPEVIGRFRAPEISYGLFQNDGHVYCTTDRYGVIEIPRQPDGSVPTTLQDFRAVRTEAGIRLAWRLESDSRPQLKLATADGRLVGYSELGGSDYEALDAAPTVFSGEALTYFLEAAWPDNEWIDLGQVDVAGIAGKKESRLLPPSPNPFNPRTTVSFYVDHQQQVAVRVFDLGGKCLTVLADRWFPAGSHSLVWDGRNLQGQEMASGTYLVRMESDEGVSTSKAMLLR